MHHFRFITLGGLGLLAWSCLALAAGPFSNDASKDASADVQKEVLTGPAVFTDYRLEKPGTRHKITVGDLPKLMRGEAL